MRMRCRKSQIALSKALERSTFTIIAFIFLVLIEWSPSWVTPIASCIQWSPSYDARTWYDDLPDKSIKAMEQFGETFMNRWSTEEEPDMLCDMNKKENYEEEQELPHDFAEDNEDLIEEQEPEEVSHEELVSAPPLDEVIQASIPPTQE
jgi:hypothetical protein